MMNPKSSGHNRSVQDKAYDEIFRSMVVDNTVHLLSTRRNLYALNTKTQEATFIPMHNANTELEQIPESALDFHKIPKSEPVPDWLKKDASLIDMLFWDGAVLYGVNELNGALYRIEIDELEATLYAVSSLDFFSGIDTGCMPSIRSGVVCAGSLYLLMSLAADEAWPSVYRFDMDTGAREPINGQGTIVEIARYHDNHLLLLEQMDESQWQITDFDTETEAYNPLFESNKLKNVSEKVFGLLYDSWRDRILVQADKELLTFTGDTLCEVVTYLPPIWSDCWAIGEDGLLLLLKDQSIYAVSTLRKNKLSTPLQVACNGLEDWMDKGFAEAYPSIPVKHRQVYEHEAVDLFAEQIAMQSDEIDIFEIPIGSAAQKAIEKGYYYPLNQSGAICEKIGTYRPFFQKIAMNGNDIAAIPRVVEQRTVAYSEYALAQLGLTVSDMPSSFMGLMDFLLEWDEKVGDIAQQAEITPFGLSNKQVKAELFHMFMGQYYALMEKDASSIPLYESDMAELLDKLSLVCSIMPEGIEEKPYGTRAERFGHIKVNDQRSYLFSVSGSFHPGRRNFLYYESVSDFVPIALTLPSQDVPILQFDGTIFIVNPYSSQKEKAILWLTYYVNHLPANDAAALNNDAVPVESEMYSAMKEYYTSEIERLETRAQAAEGVAKSDLKAQIQERQKQLHGIEQIKWDVSAQALKDYERIWTQCAVLWKDAYVYADSFNKTYATYIAEGMEGKTVAHEFFATHEMIVKESR